MLLACGLNVLAGGWVPKQGQAYQKWALNQFQTDTRFNQDGEAQDMPEFTDTNLSYYFEFGFAPRWAVLGALSYKDLSADSVNGDSQDASGFGDVDLGLRYALIENRPTVLAAQLLVKLPYLYDETDTLPRGNGQEDIELRLALGRGLGKFGYIGLEGGHRWRLEAPSDEWRYQIEYGLSFSPNWYGRTKIDGTSSRNNASVLDLPESENPTLLLDADLTRWEWTIGWHQAPRLEGQWGVEATVTPLVDGRNTAKGTQYQIGVTLQF